MGRRENRATATKADGSIANRRNYSVGWTCSAYSERANKVEFTAIERIVRLPSECDMEKLVSSIRKSTAR